MDTIKALVIIKVLQKMKSRSTSLKGNARKTKSTTILDFISDIEFKNIVCLIK
jgi:hypothetical protein